jgi:hypothetical protein
MHNISYPYEIYEIILRLFHWMQIDETALLYGIDHVDALLRRIDEL